MSNSLDYEFMRSAYQQAKRAYEEGEVPIGAVIVHEGCIIAEAYNQTEQTQNPLAHAELLAIQEASRILHTRRLTDCTLYITLEPCAMCAGAILLSRIPRIVFACHEPKSGAVLSLFTLLTDERLNHQCIVHSGVMEKECSSLLSSFFLELRNGTIARSIDRNRK